ncbi:MAG: hypothetical protein P8Y10_02445 [Gemmatimonadales bacterium]|jgi:hypothetical protein
MVRRAVLIFLVATSVGAQGLNAQQRQTRRLNLGPQLSYGSSSKLGLGGRLHANLRSPDGLVIIGAFDWFFPDEGPGDSRTYWELNGNVAYRFKIEGTTAVAPYAGGGLNIAYSSRRSEGGGDGSSDTDLGVNLLGGTLFGSGPVLPFFELRVELAGGEQFVLTGGVLF